MRRNLAWLFLILLAAATAPFALSVSRPPEHLTVGLVAPGMTQAQAESLLGRPASIGMTKDDNRVQQFLTVASYPARELSVYYSRAARVVNVRGRTLESAGRVVARAGIRRAVLHDLLGQPAIPINGEGEPKSEIYGDLEVYLHSDADGSPEWSWENGTVDYFELGSRL